MLKMYHRHHAGGGTPEFWEEVWRDGQFEEALRFCNLDPLRPIFEKLAKPGQLMLEGGCGRGQYLIYQSDRGVKVVGLDFALEALAEIHRRRPSSLICAGDVSRLPFRNNSFDVYYSGGVAEHFEAGARLILDEARRVLRPNGTLLISVPYLSPFRIVASIIWRKDRTFLSNAILDGQRGPSGREFFQYAFTKREFRRILATSGFSTKSVRGYSLVWGLYDLPVVPRIMHWMNKRRKALKHLSGTDEAGNSCETGTGGSKVRPSVFKRMLVSEDDSVPIAGVLVCALRWFCANMVMYVCTRDD